MSITTVTFTTRKIPFEAFAPCHLQGCVNYAEKVLIVVPGAADPIARLGPRDLCNEHAAEAINAGKRVPDRNGAYRSLDGRIVFDASGWRS